MLSQFHALQSPLLQNNGLNIYAVFNIDALPADVFASLKNQCSNVDRYHQLILIGHGGKTLWSALKQSGIQSEHPVDDFTVNTIERFFAKEYSARSYEIVYPGTRAIGLQNLGMLAGWHHASPFRVGINHHWGSWYAYRAVVLADTAFDTTPAIASKSPCQSCQHYVCISRCPASALKGGQFDLKKCVAYRKQIDSNCRNTCLARVACPVSNEHRYSDEQIHYHYSISMRVIEREY